MVCFLWDRNKFLNAAKRNRKWCWMQAVSKGLINKHHAMKTMWHWKFISTIVDIGAVSGPLYPQRNNPGYPLGRRLSRPQRRSGRYGEEKNWTETLGRRLIATPTELSSMQIVSSLRGITVLLFICATYSCMTLTKIRDWMLQTSVFYYCFVFRTSRFQISARWPDVLRFSWFSSFSPGKC
jgi:hypothetical protein